MKKQFKANDPLSPETFQGFLDTYGGDPAKWPEGQREAALAYAQSTQAARDAWATAQRLDQALASGVGQVPPHVLSRVLDIPKEAPPRQRGHSFAEWLTWPPLSLRPAFVLATSMVLGMVVGTLSGFPLDETETDVTDAQAIELAFGFMETTESQTTESQTTENLQ